MIGSAIVDVLVTYNKIDTVYVGARSEKEFQFDLVGCHRLSTFTMMIKKNKF